MSVVIRDSKEKLSEKKIAEVETRLGINFPSEYKRFLLKHNGGYPTPSEFSLNGEKDKSNISYFLAIHEGESSNLLSMANIMAERIPGDMLPIAYDDFGNLVLIGVTGLRLGQIFFWDHEQENPEDGSASLTYLADSLPVFLGTLR